MVRVLLWVCPFLSIISLSGNDGILFFSFFSSRTFYNQTVGLMRRKGGLLVARNMDTDYIGNTSSANQWKRRFRIRKLLPTYFYSPFMRVLFMG